MLNSHKNRSSFVFSLDFIFINFCFFYFLSCFFLYSFPNEPGKGETGGGGGGGSENQWGGGGEREGIPMMGIMGCYKNIIEPHGDQVNLIVS